MKGVAPVISYVTSIIVVCPSFVCGSFLAPFFDYFLSFLKNSCQNWIGFFSVLEMVLTIVPFWLSSLKICFLVLLDAFVEGKVVVPWEEDWCYLGNLKSIWILFWFSCLMMRSWSLEMIFWLRLCTLRSWDLFCCC